MDHATPSQRVVGSIPTRRTSFRRSQLLPPTEEALSRDRTTGLVSGNQARCVSTEPLPPRPPTSAATGVPGPGSPRARRHPRRRGICARFELNAQRLPPRRPWGVPVVVAGQAGGIALRLGTDVTNAARVERVLTASQRAAGSRTAAARDIGPCA